jgi:hypothetical protein
MQWNARKRGKRKQNETKCRGTHGNTGKGNKMKQNAEERPDKQNECREKV